MKKETNVNQAEVLRFFLKKNVDKEDILLAMRVAMKKSETYLRKYQLVYHGNNSWDIISP